MGKISTTSEPINNQKKRNKKDNIKLKNYKKNIWLLWSCTGRLLAFPARHLASALVLSSCPACLPRGRLLHLFRGCGRRQP